MKVKETNQINKENIKGSTFGCRNCLWAGIECKGQEKFIPKIANGLPSCNAYTYCD